MTELMDPSGAPPDLAHRALVERLYYERYSQMVGLATLVLGGNEAAEDVVQDAFSGLYHRDRPLDDPDRAVGYLYRSVINGCRSKARRRRIEADHRHPVPEPTSQGADQLASDSADMERIAAALAELPRRQRECIVCKAYLDMTHVEIAESLGISLGSVKTHLDRAIKRLRIQLGDIT